MVYARGFAVALCPAIVLLTACPGDRSDAARSIDASAETVEWPTYGNDAGGTKYSTLAQINRENVSDLTVAWTARAGDFPPETFERATHGGDDGLATDARAVGACTTCHGSEVKFEATPVMRDGTLFLSTPLNRVLALDAVTGDERWSFNPEIDPDGSYSEGFVSRGVSIWDDANEPTGPCGRRVFTATLDARLVALDATTGEPCAEFGGSGSLDLTGEVAINGHDVDVGQYEVTSPPAILDDLVIVGSAIGDNRRRDVESGVVRAYDARSGELRWSFDPIPRGPEHPAADAWSESAMRTTGAANVWSVISVDAERDLVFLPTGSPAPDFYGGERPGRNDFANSVVALRGATGEVAWSFQVVHHDLWDFDVPAQPVLIELSRDGGPIPAVAVGTKMGHVFVLHRETGEPIFPVEERPVPASDVPGEESWPTQPFPVLPPPLHPTTLTPDEAWGVTEQDREFCRSWISGLRNEGVFTPPSLDGILMWPGFGGGISWDGMAWDPDRQMLVTTIKHLAMFLQLHRRPDFEAQDRVEGRQYTAQGGTPYGMSRQPLVSPSGLPCSPPPFGTLVAVDLTDGSVRWEVPVGRIPGLEAMPGSEDWGSLIFGGPLVTAGGLTFVAAGQDDRMRAFDTDTGRLLWEHELPAGGQAAPMTYGVDGHQFVVIAAGGRGGIGSPGDYIVAFALPR